MIFTLRGISSVFRNIMCFIIHVLMGSITISIHAFLFALCVFQAILSRIRKISFFAQGAIKRDVLMSLALRKATFFVSKRFVDII
jgi:hypothetical protein